MTPRPGIARRWLLPALLLAACSPAPDLSLTIRLPGDKRLLATVTKLNLSATRDERVLAQASFPSTAGEILVSGVEYGPRTVVRLQGLSSSGNVIAGGRTCPVDFEGPGTKAALYFAPTNFFAPTASAPAVARTRPVALPLDDGTVLIAGGAADGTSATVLAGTELFTPGVATFAAAPPALALPRWQAQAVTLPSIGVLVVGGLDAGGNPIAEAELYRETERQFLSIADARLDGRVDHRVVVLPDGRAFVSGGRNAAGAPLATTLFIYVLSDGTYQVGAGPPLQTARRGHAATVAAGIPLVFGGYDATGSPLKSIELIDPSATSAEKIADLIEPRAEATVSVLGSSILVVGGVGANNEALATAELFNPLTRTTTKYTMAVARRGHTATVLSDGRVLVAGGFDAGGYPITSVELFDEDVGFLTERSLGTARGGHTAVPLCDGTVLMVGGGAGAELYSAPAS